VIFLGHTISSGWWLDKNNTLGYKYFLYLKFFVLKKRQKTGKNV
jgi:hypothetical protein